MYVSAYAYEPPPARHMSQAEVGSVAALSVVIHTHACIVIVLLHSSSIVKLLNCYY